MTPATRKWLVAASADDVAVSLIEMEIGTEIQDLEAGFTVSIRQNVPFGHKFATKFIPKGDFVHKYGQVIGIASVDIQPGDYVHVHNLESRRGRGDLVGRSES